MSATTMTATPLLLRAARVRRAHGVRGEVRVQPLGGDGARFTAGLALRVESTGRELVVCEAREVADGDVLLRLAGIDTRDAAETLRDAYLCVAATERRELGPTEWFDFELVGLRARTPEGVAVGVVADVEHYPEQDVLVVEDADGHITRLPLVHAFVGAVDVGAGEIVVTPWPEEGEGS